MKIVPSRNMFLDGRRVERGQVEEVSAAAGELAIRNRWAEKVAEKSAGKGKAADNAEGAE